MSWHGHVHQESLVMMLIDLLIWLHQQLEPSIFMLLTKMMERMSKLLGICSKCRLAKSHNFVLSLTISLNSWPISCQPEKTADIWHRCHWFPRQMTSEKQGQKFHTNDVSLPDWSCHMKNLIQPIRSTTQIWVVTHHHYGISALVYQTSFGGETSGSIAKCLLFSQANLILLWDDNWFLTPLLKSQTPKNFWSIFRVHFQAR